MNNQIDDRDDDSSVNVVEPDENEWRKYIDELVNQQFNDDFRRVEASSLE
jgi:hypothetical protein